MYPFMKTSPDDIATIKTMLQEHTETIDRKVTTALINIERSFKFQGIIDNSKFKTIIRQEIQTTEDNLHNAITDLRKELKQDMLEVRNELKEDMLEVRNELKEDLLDVKKELKQDMHERFESHAEMMLSGFREIIEEALPSLNEHEKKIEDHETRIVHLESPSP